MQTNNLKYLKFVRFKEVEQWDVKRFLPNCNIQFQNSIKLKDILFPCFENVSKDEMLKNNWSIISKINFGGNLFLRDVEEARTFKGNLNKITGDTVIYSKINVRHGCIYYHPIGATPFGVSSEYPSYKFDPQKVYGHFLVMVIRSSYFKNFLNKKTTGISKARVKPDEFLNVKIPLPSLTEQESLVSAYNSKIAEAETKEAEAEKKSKEIEEYLLSELGASVSKTKMASGLNFIKFKDVTRWDVPFFVTSAKTNSRYRLDTIQSCINHFMEDENFKSLRTETYKFPQNKFHYIGMENIEKQTGILVDLPEVNGQEIKSQTISVPQGYFLYGKLRPYLNKYWVNDSDKNDIVCSSEFFVFSIKGDINTLFFKYVLSSRIVQEQIAEATSGARMPRITENIFKNINIPLPPLEIQNDMVAHISEQKKQVKQLKQEAKELRERALKDFENEIFG